MGTPVSFTFTLMWETSPCVYGERDILATVSSVDTDTFLLRGPTDSLALLAPRGLLEKRSVRFLYIFSLRKLIIACHCSREPPHSVSLVIAAIHHSADTDRLVLLGSHQGKEGLKGIQGPPGLLGLIVRRTFSLCAVL